VSAVDPDRLRVELAKANITKRRLAQILGEPPSTLSTWLNGAAPAPTDLAQRIEAALDLKLGSLSRPHSAHDQQ
jgi:plasmid maintenance system antidote protein VapI